MFEEMFFTIPIFIPFSIIFYHISHILVDILQRRASNENAKLVYVFLLGLCMHKNTLLKCNLPFIILINRSKSSSSFKCLWKGKNSNNNKQSSRWRRRSDLHQRFLFIYIIHSFSCHQQHHQINFDFSLQ